MRNTYKKILCLAMAVMMSLSFIPVDAGATTTSDELRQMEYLTRGLIAANVGGERGVFLSWRFLGDEPDGISWNVYRSDDVGLTWELITTIEPRDVQPESDFPANPGIVKENVTPTNFDDPDGIATSIYEVAPVINGVEGRRQGMDVPMLAMRNNTGVSAGRGAQITVPVSRYRPDPLPRPQFNFRGSNAGTANIQNRWILSDYTDPTSFVTTTYGFATGSQAPVTGNAARHQFYTVDMNLLREFRVAHAEQTAVTAAQLTDWVGRLNVHNMTPNYLGVRNLTEPWTPTVPLTAEGLITDELFEELEQQFFNYVSNLDVGDRLPLAMTDDGRIATAMGAAYNIHEMVVGDFTGNGIYDIAFKWQANSTDNMLSCPVVFGNVVTPPVFVDVVTITGEHLFRVDMGYNVKGTNDHETVLFVQDFDNSGRASLMLKTAAGTRIGHWNESLGDFEFDNCLDTVIGGEYGLGATTDMFLEYIETGNYEAMNFHWNVINGWSVSFRDPRIYGGNDGQSGFMPPSDPYGLTHMTWVKTYHIGQMGEGPLVDGVYKNYEHFTAFKFDIETGRGYIVDSMEYPFPYGDRNWGLAPMSQRGNYTYQIDRPPGNPGGRNPRFPATERYWLSNQWGHWDLGDPQGNRPNRYLGGVGALDGVNWFAISQRGYYERTTIAAFRIIDGELVNQANFDSADPIHWILKNPQCTDDECVTGNRCEYFCGAYFYQNRGNHTAHVGTDPVTGRDFYVTGAMTVGLSECGTLLQPISVHGGYFVSDWNVAPSYPSGVEYWYYRNNHPASVLWWPFRHGDRSALLPVNANNDIRHWSCREEHIVDDVRFGTVHGWSPESTVVCPFTGNVTQAIYGRGSDWDAGVAGNFTNAFPHAQASRPTGDVANAPFMNNPTRAMCAYTGVAHLNFTLRSSRNAIWWSGDLLHEGFENGTIFKADPITGFENNAATTFYALGAGVNGSVGPNKNTTQLKADIFGDWREEIVARTTDANIMIITSTIPSSYGIRTLMHDPMYRAGAATQNNGYSQHQFASFYLGDEAPLPPKRTDIRIGLPTEPPTAFTGTSPTQLNALLAEGDVKLTTPGSGGYGIAANNTLVIPEGRTLYVETILNVRRGGTLRIEGTVVVLEGGRINNDGHPTAGGGTIIIAEGGRLINYGYVESVSNSFIFNNGRISNVGTTGNLGRFEIRANTTFVGSGTVDGNRPLNIHRDAIRVVPDP